jgi:hypothetical protein
VIRRRFVEIDVGSLPYLFTRLLAFEVPNIAVPVRDKVYLVNHYAV